MKSINVRRVVSEIAVKDANGVEKFLPTREVLRIYTEYITKCLESDIEIIPFADFLEGKK
jgi:hypothetical protein